MLLQGFLSLRRHGRPLGRSLLLLRRRRCAAAPQRAPGGISAMTMGLGMAGAAVAGVALGAVLPTAWLVGEGGDEAEEAKSGGGDAQLSSARSSVHESVGSIAEAIPRPAIIVDATREAVESLYDFNTIIASGGSATVWRATERATGKRVAIKVVDKRLLLEPFLNMEVASLVRCHGHPHIMQLLAVYDVPANDVGPDGEWHLVMELAEGGELFERLLNHGAAASAEERASRRQRPRRGLSVLCRRVLGAGRVAAARPGERV